MPIYKLLAAYKPTASASDFVGVEGDIFFDPAAKALKIADGTAGGGSVNVLKVQDYTNDALVNERSIPGLAFDTDSFQLTTESDGSVRLTVIGTQGGAIRVLGSVAAEANLPASGNTLGDAYFIGTNLHVWNGTSWVNSGDVKGSQGTTGGQGSVGPLGGQGVQGNLGQTGPIGLQGTQGINGETGLQGRFGIQGDTGTQGSFGPTGSQGPVGLRGIQGTNGTQGTVGAQGAVGPIGTQGTQGTQGLQGVQGTQGTQGLQGNIGFQGVQGNDGSKITSGEFPVNGTDVKFVLSDGSNFTVSNARGYAGSIGAIGPQGTTGDTGPQGTTGAQGDTGPQGTTGAQGDTGPQGTTGDIGVQGTQGPVGYDGSIGALGPIGYSGSQGPAVNAASIVNDELILAFDDATVSDVNAGNVRGPIGVQGPEGPIGPHGGAQGTTGTTGVQGPIGSTPGWTHTTTDSNNFQILEFGYDLIPSVTNTSDIGTANRRFKDIYLSGNIFSKDNTLLIDAENNKITAPILNLHTLEVDEILNPDSTVVFFRDSIHVEGDILSENDIIAEGKFIGDIKGSVFADDSTMLVNGVDGNIPWTVLADTPTTLTGYGITDAESILDNIDITGSTIHTRDSSILKLGQRVNAQSDFEVQGNLLINRIQGDGSSAIEIDSDISITGDLTVDKAVYTNRIGSPDSSGVSVEDNLTIEGNLLLNYIDSPDSAGIFVTPTVTMLSDLSVENDLVVRNSVTATEFIGDGSKLTGIVGGGGGGGEAYDQTLNTTDDVTFQSVTLATDGKVVFPDGSEQITTAPRFFTDTADYNTKNIAGTIIAGDYLYDYGAGSLFVTSFTPFQGWLLNGGVGYGTVANLNLFAGGFGFDYLVNVPLSGGSGTGAAVTMLILNPALGPYDGSAGEITAIFSIDARGSGYTKGDVCDFNLEAVGSTSGTGAQFLVGGVTSTGGVDDGALGLFDLTVY